MLAQSLAVHLKIPGIVLLLLSGLILGPDLLGIVDPERLGGGLSAIVGLAVAIILFEGSLNLTLDRLRREATVIRRLITVGALITALGGTLAAHILMGWEWRLAALFGTLVIVTGPTVITPLLRRIRVTQKVETILEAEGILIDPVGAIIAVVTLELFYGIGPDTPASGILGLPGRLLVGLLVGGVGGILIGLLLRYERFIPERLEGVFTLSLVLTLFELSNAILPDSGIMAAVVAGLVVGGIPSRTVRELVEFKERLTTLFVGLLFVLLAADVRITEVIGLGWPGLLTVIALMVIVRPIDVLVSAWGSDLDPRERTFIAWLGPRGIVAAAVSSLFAERLIEQGIVEGIELRALVFLVIAVTVVVQGLSGGPVASLLGVRRRQGVGYLIAGANPLGRALAHALRGEGEEIVLIDTNALSVGAAEGEALPVIYGNAGLEGPLLRADIDARRGYIAATTNSGINLLLTRRAREEYQVGETYVLFQRGKTGVRPEEATERGSSILFGQPIDALGWIHRLEGGKADFAALEIDEEGEYPAQIETFFEEWTEGSILPLTLTRAGVTRPFGEETEPRPGDRIILLRGRDQRSGTRVS